MSRRNREPGRRDAAGPESRDGGSTGSAVPMVTLIGVGVAIAVGIVDWNQTRSLRTSIDEKVAQIQGSVNGLATKVDQVARASGQRPAPPDPNKVYPITIGNSAIRGPKNAPVTLVEFSDYQ